ncbi:MAG: transcriptional repressor LexA [Anaerolineaceae bacterium]|nr:transcriptional repressor LexA [Anaerolineaceae bacterium]MDE0327517.1 transcriptional repressor LexA [Anaerolineaceae bacterium]MDE0610602.1 transcriptional repressor LexA [Anaerolineaceae bacterium]
MTKRKGLSARQQHILRYMDQYMGEHGYPPTIREIGAATHINSTSVVNYNLNKLVQAGYLERRDRVSRGMRLVKWGRAADNLLRVPLAGRIVASAPVEAYADGSGDMLDVAPATLGNNPPGEVFALRVQGDSMIDAMIADGDIVLLRRADTAQNGELVAVWLADEEATTLKRFYHEGQRVRLQPENPTMDPIYVDAAQCRVQGVVVAVIRHSH